MLIKRIGLPWITVSNLQQAKNLFVNTLGMKVSTDTPEYNWLELSLGDFKLGIGQEGASQKAGHNAVLTFVVDNIMEAKNFLREKGVCLIGDIMEVPGHVKLLTFIDADNNMFQLVEEINNSQNK
jgi:predicted enzyme related to lactoylglutathione lyase